MQPDSGKVTIEVEGTDQQLAQLQSADMQAIVDASQLGPGEYTENVKVSVPPEVRVVNASNLKAVIRIKDQVASR
ncbi:CdaR family protein [Aneurinibacillus sp. Ricciae_BoGa-3]|uniref:CdaR family protein n=1 Tax=Aneurinibacillus sp. Ricciae_BoGa-3 TaxID=3022697 RepID=UPI00234018C9|nr:CdaR family protein [Aneurinibacillus sp. Ricciae_BoGa-3]WCK54808.1 CdaR family protein [Aneurinibacillus sp. Ricciae_BoGa-3]